MYGYAGQGISGDDVARTRLCAPNDVVVSIENVYSIAPVPEIHRPGYVGSDEVAADHDLPRAVGNMSGDGHAGVRCLTTGDDVARRRVCSSDGVFCRTEVDKDPFLGIAEKGPPRHIGAEIVPLHKVFTGAGDEGDGGISVSREDIPRRRGRPADPVLRRFREDSIPDIADAGGAIEIGADEVTFDDVAAKNPQDDR